jgi:TonB family protein
MIAAMVATAIRSDWVGEVIDGRFSLLEWLGGSDRSGVFLTELPGPQARKAAIKLTFADSDEDIETHIAGWAATRPLSHPHLMRLLHTGRCEMGDGILLYSVAEYADEVLSEILPQRALTPDEAKEMLVPIVDTLAYLHGKGLVHGHLKPSNILVVDDKLKLSGDSLQTPGETGMQVSGLSIYDAPERADGVISLEGDLWSLGVTLVEALTQKPPVWDKATDEDPIVPSSIPQPLAGIARGCLRADPMGRCTLANVKNWMEAKASAKELARMPVEKAPTKFPMTALVAIVVVVVAAVAVMAVRSHKTDATGTVAAVSTESQQQAASAATTTQTPAQEQPTPAPEPQAQDPTPSAATPAETPQASTPAPVQEQAPAAVQAPAPQPAVAMQSSPPVGAPAEAAVVEEVQPDVSPKALASIHGKLNVRIRVEVDAAGNVSNASFESEGPSQYFANAAMKAAQRWKFKPGQEGSSILQFLFTQSGAETSAVAAH